MVENSISRRLDCSVDRPKIMAWDAPQKKLKNQFLLCNTAWISQDALKLEATEMVKRYVKDFCSLMLDIKNMSKEDKLFNFIVGFRHK